MKYKKAAAATIAAIAIAAGALLAGCAFNEISVGCEMDGDGKTGFTMTAKRRFK